MYDVIIIGAGPAGISAALYAKRANREVLVLYSGESQLEKAEKIENYYGFDGGISGKELYKNGIAQAETLGVKVRREEVLKLSVNASMNFEVSSADNKYEGRSLIIAAGSKKLKPDIKNTEAFEGRGISYCAVCDGFFYRNKNVAVLGSEAYALSEAEELENIAGSVKILTDGRPAPDTDKFEVITKKIAEFSGNGRLGKVIFEDKSELEADGVFIAQGSAGGADFAKKLGIVLDGNNIRVKEDMSTNIPGVFACGDITGGMLQVGKAVYEGAEAGLSAVKYLKEKTKAKEN